MVQAFKAGDIVRLKSGSPRMMLTSVDHRGYVRTAWAVGTDTRHGDFHLDALLGVPAGAPSDPQSDDRSGDPRGRRQQQNIYLDDSLVKSNQPPHVVRARRSSGELQGDGHGRNLALPDVVAKTIYLSLTVAVLLFVSSFLLAGVHF